VPKDDSLADTLVYADKENADTKASLSRLGAKSLSHGIALERKYSNGMPSKELDEETFQVTGDKNRGEIPLVRSTTRRSKQDFFFANMKNVGSRFWRSHGGIFLQHIGREETAHIDIAGCGSLGDKTVP
jgi:leucyl aminopeptidase